MYVCHAHALLRIYSCACAYPCSFLCAPSQWRLCSYRFSALKPWRPNMMQPIRCLHFMLLPKQMVTPTQA